MLVAHILSSHATTAATEIATMPFLHFSARSAAHATMASCGTRKPLPLIVLVLVAVHSCRAEGDVAAAVRTDQGGNLHLTPAPNGRVYLNGTDVLGENHHLKTVVAEQRQKIALLEQRSQALDNLGLPNQSLLDLLVEMKKQTDYVKDTVFPFDKLYAVGGHSGGDRLSSVEKFDGERWTTAPSISTARSEFGVAKYEVDGKEYLFAVGGSDGGISLSSVEKFDGLKWTSAPPMGTARKALGVAVYAVDGKEYLFAIGGRAGNSRLKTVEKFDGEQWSSAPSMISRRGALGVAVYKVDDKEILFAVGGHDGVNTLSSVEKFDGVEWTSAPSLDTRRKTPALAVYSVDGKEYLFAVGGYDENKSEGDPTLGYLRIVEKFDGAKWTGAPSMGTAREWHKVAVFSVDGNEYMFAVGGRESYGYYLNSVEKFDGERWTTAPSMGITRDGLGLAVF